MAKRRLGRGLDSLLGGPALPTQEPEQQQAKEAAGPEPATSQTGSSPGSAGEKLAAEQGDPPSAQQPDVSRETSAHPAQSAAATAVASSADEAGNADVSPAADTGPDPQAIAATDVAPEAAGLGRPLEVDIERIVPNPYQPRQDFDEGALEEMMRSIQANGIIQPVVVREHDGNYQLIAGERRLRACLALGIERVPVVVNDVPDNRMLELALIENLQRRDLNPIEKAEAFQGYIARYGLTQEEAARRIGMDRPSLANHLRLLELPASVQRLVRQGLLGMSHARTLVSLADLELQTRLAGQAARDRLTVRQLEQAVQNATRALAAKGDLKSGAKAGQDKNSSPQVANLEEEMRRLLGTKVRVQEAKRKGMGRIVIDYYTYDDFDRILSLLRG